MENQLGTGNVSVNHQPHRYQHPCPFKGCDRVFTCPHNVRQHVAEKHSEEREHKCWLCVAEFARPWGLNRHLDMVHNIKVGPGRGKTKRTRGGKRASPAAYTPSTNVENGSRMSAPEYQDESTLPYYDPFMAAGDALGTPSNSNTPNDNFAYHEVSCSVCLAFFDNNEDLLGHLHLSHNAPYNPSCDCMVCSGRFPRNNAKFTNEQTQNYGYSAAGMQDMPWPQQARTSNAQLPYYVNGAGNDTSSHTGFEPNGQYGGSRDFDFAADDLFSATAGKPDEGYSYSSGGMPAQQQQDFTEYSNTRGNEFMYLQGGASDWLRDADAVTDWLQDPNAVYGSGADVKMDEADDI